MLAFDAPTDRPMMLQLLHYSNNFLVEKLLKLFDGKIDSGRIL